MPAYLVTLDRTKGGRTLRNGANAMVVFASSGPIALEMAAAKFPGDGSVWATNGTATEIVAAADWAGWTFKVSILGGFGTGATDPASVTVVADATTNTMDEVGAALVTALNALPVVANASYAASTNILTIASAADALGDQQVVVSITPPAGESPVDSLVGTIVDGGVAAAALTVVLPADAAVVPLVAATLTQAD